MKRQIPFLYPTSFIRIVEYGELVNAQDLAGVVCTFRDLEHRRNERSYKLTVTSWLPILSLGVAGKTRGKRPSNVGMSEDGLPEQRRVSRGLMRGPGREPQVEGRR